MSRVLYFISDLHIGGDEALGVCDFEDELIAFLEDLAARADEDVELISFGCVESRLFGGWTMHAIGIFEFNRDLLDDLIEQYGEEDGSVRFPVEEWKVLALISDLRQG